MMRTCSIFSLGILSVCHDPLVSGYSQQAHDYHSFSTVGKFSCNIGLLLAKGFRLFVLEALGNFGRTVLLFVAFNDRGTALTCTHKTNVVGTLNMLGLAKRVGARFLLTSTSEVYGDPLEHPQKGGHLRSRSFDFLQSF